MEKPTTQLNREERVAALRERDQQLAAELDNLGSEVESLKWSDDYHDVHRRMAFEDLLSVRQSEREAVREELRRLDRQGGW